MSGTNGMLRSAVSTALDVMAVACVSAVLLCVLQGFVEANADIGNMLQMFPSNAWSAWILGARNIIRLYEVAANDNIKKIHTLYSVVVY